MSDFTLTYYALRKSEHEYHENFRQTLGWIEHIASMSRNDIFKCNVIWARKLWPLVCLYLRVSRGVYNLLIPILKNLYSIHIIIIIGIML